MRHKASFERRAISLRGARPQVERRGLYNIVWLFAPHWQNIYWELCVPLGPIMCARLSTNKTLHWLNPLCDRKVNPIWAWNMRRRCLSRSKVTQLICVAYCLGCVAKTYETQEESDEMLLVIAQRPISSTRVEAGGLILNSKASSPTLSHQLLRLLKNAIMNHFQQGSMQLRDTLVYAWFDSRSTKNLSVGWKAKIIRTALISAGRLINF